MTADLLFQKVSVFPTLSVMEHYTPREKHIPVESMELMSEFDFTDLSRFTVRANELEAQVREIITAHGGVIREYKSPEEFLHEV